MARDEAGGHGRSFQILKNGMPIVPLVRQLLADLEQFGHGLRGLRRYSRPLRQSGYCAAQDIGVAQVVLDRAERLAGARRLLRACCLP